MRHIAILGISAVLISGLGGIGWGEGPGPAPEELFKKLDANADGKIEAKEAEGDHARIFERLVRVGDKDKDGSLSKDEFLESVKQNQDPVAGPEAFQERGRGPGRGDFDPRRIFGMLDKNHDGKLTREEATERPRIHEALEKLGKDEITADEFAEEVGKRMQGFRDGAGRPGRPEGGPPRGRGPGGPEGEGPEGRGPGGPGPHGPNFMKVFDTNKDGRLSRDELAKATEKFNELDENNDGELDPRELMGPPPEEMGEEMARGPQGGPRGEFGPRRRGPQGPQGPGSEGEHPRRFGPQGFNGPQGPPEDGPRGRRGPGAGGPPEEGSPQGGPPQDGPPQEGRRRGPEGFRGPGGPDGPGGRGMEFMQRMFEQLDANDDGKISEDEAPPKMKQRFSMIDANGDGAIDMNELGHARPGGLEGKGRGPGANRPGEPQFDPEKPENQKP